MSRQIDYRSTSTYPADEVYATMVDREYLDARLKQLGGPGAKVLEHQVGAEGGRYRIRHGMESKDLPSVVRSFLAGDVVIERTEGWTRKDPGRYHGDVEVLIKGTPASAVGGMRLHDVDASGSELLVRADVTVKVPFVGGKIEAVIAEQVQNLLAAETEFTLAWLAGRRKV